MNKEIASRIIEVRKLNNLTQTEFGERLNATRAKIAAYELYKVNYDSSFLDYICKVFGVSSEWLLTGNGEMLSDSDNFLLSSLSQQYGLDGLDRKIIEAYINLPDMQRGVIKGFVRNLVDSVLADENYEEYREDYIKTKAAPMAARRGNIDGLQEAADLYDKAKEGDTEA